MSDYVKKKKRITATYQPGFLARLDARLEVAQVLHSAYIEVTDDLGGAENLSHVKLTLAERYIFLEYQLRRWESLILANPTKSGKLVSRWVQALNSLIGLSKTLGLEKRTRKIESLESYIVEAHKNGKKRRAK